MLNCKRRDIEGHGKTPAGSQGDVPPPPQTGRLVGRRTRLDTRRRRSGEGIREAEAVLGAGDDSTQAEDPRPVREVSRRPPRRKAGRSPRKGPGATAGGPC